jgi:hypothetical protein
MAVGGNVRGAPSGYTFAVTAWLLLAQHLSSVCATPQAGDVPTLVRVSLLAVTAHREANRI